MQYLTLPGLDRAVSKLIFGAAISPMNSGKGADALLDEVLEAGVNTFDTARIYGESETCLGRWINRRGVRDKVNILTKGCHPDGEQRRVTPEALFSDVETSLRCLNVDVIDIYLLHRDDESLPVEPIIDALNTLRRQGKLRCFGASNWTHGRIAEANAYAKKSGQEGFCVSSVACCAAKRVFDPWGGCVDISEDDAAQSWYAENQMPVFAYSALARGFLSGRLKSDGSFADVFGGGGPKEYDCPENMERLRILETEAQRTGKTVSQTALLWLKKQKADVCPIVSSCKAEHIRASAAVFDE